MALTANREVDHYIDQELRSFQLAGGEHIYKGALVGLTADGYARGLVAGDPFAGIAYEEIDNSDGDDGELAVRVYTLGDFGLTLFGASQADIGRPVFAGDDETLTAGGLEQSYVGVVQDVVASNEIILRLDPLRRLVKTVTHVVGDLAAGADVAARAVHHFSQEGWIARARVVNQATAAAGINGSNTCVITLALSAGAVASLTFDSVVTFPAPNEYRDLGVVSNAQAAAGDVLTLAVTNGATANPGPFLVEVDYV